MVRKWSRKDQRVLRASGSKSGHGQSGSINPCNICNVIEIVELRQVAILDGVFHPHVLVLMPVVFIWLRKSNSRIATFKKRHMIATTPVAIAAINKSNFHLRYVSRCRLLYEARE